MNSKKIKHLIRSGIDCVFAISGILKLYESRMKRGLTILMYHRILPDEQCYDYPLRSLIIPESVFRQQVECLASNYKVLPVLSALQELENENCSSKPLVAITFDDGYYDNYSIAAPILEEFGLNATFYITSGFIETEEPQWYDKAAEVWTYLKEEDRDVLLKDIFDSAGETGFDIWMEGLKRLNSDSRQKLVMRAEEISGRSLNMGLYKPMSINEIIELDSKGHEMAAHSVTHPILTLLDAEELENEVKHSAEQLERWIGRKISGFCYPNGNHDQRTEEYLRNSGYKYACTLDEGINKPGINPYCLLRLPVTMRRTMRNKKHDSLGFRAEICRLRSLYRK